MKEMPVIDVELLEVSDEEKEIVRRIIKNTGHIRVSKPFCEPKLDPISGKAAYVWRMVVFVVGTRTNHHCMPWSADFDLPAFDEKGRWCNRLAQIMAKELEKLVDKIIDLIPKEKWEGVHRYSQIF